MDSFDADVERWRAGPHVKPLLVAVADFDPAEYLPQKKRWTWRRKERKRKRYCADDGPEEGVASLSSSLEQEKENRVKVH